MYYCKKCGAIVKIDDTFCPKCFVRLSDENRVYSYGSTLNDGVNKTDEFSADDLVVNCDLSGAKVFNYRLINRVCSYFGWNYYKAKKLDTKISIVTIAHRVVSKDEFYDLCSLNTVDKSKDILKEYSSQIVERLKVSQKDVLCLHSQKYQTYHIFVLMPEVVPLVEYYSNTKLSFNEIANIGLNIVNKSIELNLFENIINDINVCISSAKEVYIFNSVIDIDRCYFVSTPYTIYNSYFETDTNNRLSYSIGIILYLMLNSGRYPFQEDVFNSSTYHDMVSLKDRHMIPKRELLMEYPIGKIIEYSLYSTSNERDTIYTLKTLLEKYLV